jgi:hypothetical protein
MDDVDDCLLSGMWLDEEGGRRACCEVYGVGDVPARGP